MNMSKMNSILVLMPADGSAGPALHRAMAWARRSGAVLHLNLFVHYEPIDYAGAVFGAEVADRARRDFIGERMAKLGALAAGLAANDLQVECDVIWAREPARAIVGRCRELRPDLVIKDIAVSTDGRGHLHPGALDWKLLRQLPAPLMLVRPTAAVDLQRVLVAVDLGVDIGGGAGRFNERLLEAGRACALPPTAQLKLGSVFSCAPLPGDDAGFIAETWALMDRAHEDALRLFSASHGLKPAQALRCQAVETACGIASLAEQAQADLVVLGASYHGVLDRLLFGTTAESAIRKLSADLLLIKPAGFDVAADEVPKRGRRLPPGRQTVGAPLS